MKPNPVCLLFGMTLLSSSAYGQSLLQRAEAKREEAEQRLRSARRDRLERQATLSKEAQALSQKLFALRAERQGLEAKLSRARLRIQDFDRDRAKTERSEQSLRRLLGQAGNLEPSERLTSAEAMKEMVETGIDARLSALEKNLQLHRLPSQILDRNGRPQQAFLMKLGRFTALALGDHDDATGFAHLGLVPQIVGPALSPEAISALRRAQQGEQFGPSDRFPFDLDGALTGVVAQSPAPQQNSLAAGGPFVWPIVALGLLSLVLFLDRLRYFLTLRPDLKHLAQVTELLARNDQASVPQRNRTDLDRVLKVGASHFGASRRHLEEALENVLLQEEPRLERGLSLLGAIAGIAPLLGLLGTVTGMIATFDVISTFGTGNPKLLSAGISEALITTQFGLMVAVPTLLAFAWTQRQVRKRQALLEEARTQILMAHPESEP